MGKIPIYLLDSLQFEELTLEIHSPPTIARIDSHLCHRYGYLSRSYIQKLIRSGEVKVNGEAVRVSKRIRAGDRILMRLPVIPERVIEPEDIELDIIHEDQDILVVNKPPDLTCHAGKKYHGGTLANAVIYHLYGAGKDAGRKNPGIVHRLDKNTSGVMALAKNPEAHRTLARQFAQGHVEKEYLGVVKGLPKRSRGVIDSPIGYHPYLRNTVSVRMDAVKQKTAITHYSIVERFRQGALVSLMPKTGRTHQLRVHLESIRHPLFGEERYSGRYSWSSFDRAINRQALHAWRLRIVHPTTREPVTYEAELPPDAARLLTLLREDTPNSAEARKHHGGEGSRLGTSKRGRS